MMYLLDTDHLSLLERGGAEAERLLARLASVRPEGAATTIVTYEEQTRGWLSYMAKARSLDAQVAAYRRLDQHLQIYCGIPVLGFDEEAAEAFLVLLRSRLRIGTMDLRIAAIAIANDATLLTRNLSHFRQVPGLRAEDWTA